jgi:hypothetical protein
MEGRSNGWSWDTPESKWQCLYRRVSKRPS